MAETSWSPCTDLCLLPQAHELQAHDLASLWNVALVQQKGVEILFALPVERRTLAEINIALADLEQSQAFVLSLPHSLRSLKLTLVPLSQYL